MCSHRATAVRVGVRRTKRAAPHLRLLLLLCRGRLCSRELVTGTGLLKQQLLLPTILRITNADRLPGWSLDRRAAVRVPRVAVHLRAAARLLQRRGDLNDDAAAVQAQSIFVI